MAHGRDNSLFASSADSPGLRVGPLQISAAVLLAPMSGITDLPFRRLAHRFEAPLTFTEMIASRELVREAGASQKTRQWNGGPRRFDVDEASQPHAVQLAGCDPDVMADAARLSQDQGADLIDINFGCPVKKVAKGQSAGSALMRDESLATRIVAAVVAAVDLPVTVKMRTGWDITCRNAPSLARRVEDVGAAMVTIHGRTRQQLYNGNADWSFIGEIKRSVAIPVIANGDVRSAADITQCLAASGADGVMIGRGTQGKPWLVGHLARWMRTGVQPLPPSLTERYTLLLEHYDLMLSYYDLRRGLPLARKQLGWAIEGMRGAAEARQAVFAADCPKRVTSILRDLFHNNSEPLARAA